MTNRIALWLAATIVLLALADIFLDDGRVLLFLSKKILDLVQYIAFWR
ncbi:glyceraldehyde-3-phosphate dehydrogenase [Thioclava dalianensis]|uniref:Glyceraldehyde-3-phosphate dehydrogenase n=1 Tax=Thioclava dalianensis TaxID=1185766 RepID=A0A074U5K3_9RHOB|nr:hypothetical protein [Thioclava dalianensis]KEP69917.1 glyceraldehyde-3-phosphate dehydrogenase [Thioclava dalianensis]